MDFARKKGIVKIFTGNGKRPLVKDKCKTEAKEECCPTFAPVCHAEINYCLERQWLSLQS